MSIVPESIEYNILNIPPVLLMSWLAWSILIFISVTVRFTLKVIPEKLQSLLELCFEWVFNLADDFIGPEAPRFYPLFIGLFLFILTGNLLGLVPGLISPTSKLNVTISLSLSVFIYYNFQGFRKYGIKYLAHFFGPALPWYLTPVRGLIFMIEIISHFARPFSLALRLFCNIFSKEILLGLLALLMVKFFMGHDIVEKCLSIAPFLLRPIIIILGLIIGFIQALIFMVLSIAYVAGAVKTEEEH